MTNGLLSPDTDDLTYWVIELQQGRPDAAEPVCRKIVARVEELARAMFRQFPRVGRFVDLDDVVQSALVRLLNACRTVCPTSRRHFYALTGELIRRELLDLTRHYFGPLGEGANLADVVVGEGRREYTPADQTADPTILERASAFHEAVNRLPVREREVIGLTYYHGWTQTEIANLLRVSLRTVQRCQKSGIFLLRQAALDRWVTHPVTRPPSRAKAGHRSPSPRGHGWPGRGLASFLSRVFRPPGHRYLMVRRFGVSLAGVCDPGPAS